jgi:hypothetical protein
MGKSIRIDSVERIDSNRRIERQILDSVLFENVRIITQCRPYGGANGAQAPGPAGQGMTYLNTGHGTDAV